MLRVSDGTVKASRAVTTWWTSSCALNGSMRWIISAPWMEPVLQAWCGPATEEHDTKFWHEIQLAPRFVSALVQAFWDRPSEFRMRHRLHFDDAGEHDAFGAACQEGEAQVREQASLGQYEKSICGICAALGSGLLWEHVSEHDCSMVQRHRQHMTMVVNTLGQ